MPKLSQTKRDALFKMVRSRALWAVDSAPAIGPPRHPPAADCSGGTKWGRPAASRARWARGIEDRALLTSSLVATH